MAIMTESRVKTTPGFKNRAIYTLTCHWTRTGNKNLPLRGGVACRSVRRYVLFGDAV